MAKELTKVLVKDISCNPINAESGLFMQVCERANFWGQKAADMGVQNALGQAIQYSAKELLKNLTSDQNDFDFDLKMIQQVGLQLEAQAPDLKQEFSRFVSTISEHYVDTIEALFPALHLQNNEIVQKAQFITKGMQDVAYEVESWARGANTVLDGIAKLPFPTEVKDFLNEIKTIPANAHNIATQIGGAIESLWNNTTDAVRRSDELNDRAKVLRNALPQETPAQKLQRESELKAVESQLARHKPELENTLGHIKSGFHALGIIAGSFGKTQLASDIMAVGDTAITVAGSIATLLAGSAATGPAMPIVAIVGAVAMLVSQLFGAKAAQRDDMILKSIERLSKHMDQRFDRIELIIQKSVIYLAEHIDRRFLDLENHLDRRFDRIEDTLKYMYKDMLQQFAKLHENHGAHLQAIQHKLDGLRQSIDYLHTDMAVNFVRLYEQDYRNARDQALTPIARHQISPVTHQQSYRAITRWIKDQVKSEILSGDDQTDNLVERIRASGMNMYINKLRARAVQSGNGIQDPGRLVHPAAWAEGVRTLISYFAVTPELYNFITPHTVIFDDISAIKNEGMRIRDFIHAIQKNFTLFDNLINQYRQALLRVMQSAYDISITADSDHPIGTASDSVEHALMRVTALENSDSFIVNEIYPQGRGRPDLLRLDAIAAHQVVAHPFPQAKILKEVAAQFAGSVRESQAFHNNATRDQCHEAYEGKSTGGFVWSFAVQNPNSPVHDWNTFEADYKLSCREARHLRALAAEYKSFLSHSHSHELATDNGYRNGRISGVLSHHAVAEKDRAKVGNELPHNLLMKKYFSIKNLNDLNNRLRTHPMFQLHLDHLQKTFEELSIFIAFAFPRQFAADPHLRVYLDRLWSKQDILDYISAESSKTDFVGLFLQNILDKKGEVETFKHFMFDFIADAKIALENSSTKSQYGHTLIENVLDELDAFEKTVKLATHVIAPVPTVVRVLHAWGSFEKTEDIKDSIFYALAKHLNCDAAALKQLVNGDDVENVLETVARLKKIEIIVVEEDLVNDTLVKVINQGEQNTVHLLHHANGNWSTFYPSKDFVKRQDYFVARLVETNINSEEELQALREQVTVLRDIVKGFTEEDQPSHEDKERNSNAHSAPQAFWSPKASPRAGKANMSDKKDLPTPQPH